MTYPVADLVHETSISNGTGNLTLAAVNGKRRASTAYGTADLGAALNPAFYISNRDAAEWEICPGYMSGANTLVRQTPLMSSNANAPVNFTAGTKDVTSDVPAAKQAWLPYTNFAANTVSLGKNAGTNPVVRFDFSAASVATGIEVVGAAAGGGVTLSAISPNANEQLNLRGKGVGGVGVIGPVAITAGNLVVSNPVGNVGSTQVIAQGRDGGYGAGISFRSMLNLSTAVGEMGNITGDGDAAWSASDANSQTASLRFRVARNGSVLEFARLTGYVDGTLYLGQNFLLGLQSSYMGYGGGYRSLRVGDNSSAVLALGIDPITIVGGSFQYGQIMIGNGAIIAPNAAGTDFMGVLRAVGGKVYVGGALASGEMIGNALVVLPGGNVGVGTTGPTVPLHTVGAVRHEGYATGYAKFDSLGNVSSDASISLDTGIFTVTATAVTNISATTGLNCQWSRNGLVVTVSGMFTADVGTLGAARVDLSVPVASDFALANDLCGVAFSIGVGGQGCPITADPTNKRARVDIAPMNPGGDANLTYAYVYQYRIR